MPYARRRRLPIPENKSPALVPFGVSATVATLSNAHPPAPGTQPRRRRNVSLYPATSCRHCRTGGARRLRLLGVPLNSFPLQMIHD